MKARSRDWLGLAQALLTVRGCARDGLKLVGRLEALLRPRSEAAALLAAIELKLIATTETARAALKGRGRVAA